MNDDFQKRIQEVHGKKGADWLLHLPELLKKYTSQWQLQDLRAVSDLSYNFVARGLSSTGKRVMLKCSIPGPEMKSEIFALETYQASGCVRLLQSAPSEGLILLEEIAPGNTLREHTLSGRDEEAVQITCRIISKLHEKGARATPMPSSQSLASRLDSFRSLRERFGAGTGPFEARIIERAEEELQRLLETTDQSILLHADLHHLNILQAHHPTWLAIDPQGIFGDPAFEVAAFMRNPVTDMNCFGDIKSMMNRRINLFSETLEFDRNRIWAWTFVQTVLSSWWIYEDHGVGWEPWFGLSKLFLELEC